MDKKTYIKNFSNAIKWRISEPEADEILEDYNEIFSEYSDDDNLLVQKLGEPIEAAKVLTEPKQYRNWLVMFTFMAICIVIPELMLLRMTFYQTPILVTSFLFVLGVLGSLIWFRPQKGKKIAFTKDILITFIAMLVINFVCLGFFSGLITQKIALIPMQVYGVIAHKLFQLLATIITIIGIVSLIKARTQNRHWKTIYITSLIIVFECMLIVSFLVSMEPFVHFWQMSTIYAIILGLIGLIGVILSLC